MCLHWESRLRIYGYHLEWLVPQEVNLIRPRGGGGGLNPAAHVLIFSSKTIVVSVLIFGDFCIFFLHSYIQGFKSICPNAKKIWDLENKCSHHIYLVVSALFGNCGDLLLKLQWLLWTNFLTLIFLVCSLIISLNLT